MEAKLAERLKGERKKLAEEEARKARAAVSSTSISRISSSRS